MEIEVCSSSEPETELGVATSDSATAPSLLDRLRCPAQSELSRKRNYLYTFCFQ